MKVFAFADEVPPLDEIVACLMAGQGIGIGAQRCESHGLLACP